MTTTGAPRELLADLIRLALHYEVPARSLDDLLDELGAGRCRSGQDRHRGRRKPWLWPGMSAGLRRGRYRRLLLELHPVQLAEHGTNPAAIIEGLLEMGYRGWVIAHSAADVRRTAYAHGQPIDSLLRPLRWPEPLDAWPHLIFILGDIPLYTEVHAGRRERPSMNNHDTHRKSSQNPTSATRRLRLREIRNFAGGTWLTDWTTALMAAHDRASDRAAMVGRGLTRLKVLHLYAGTCTAGSRRC